MRPSFTALRRLPGGAARKARSAAAGTAVPVDSEPTADAQPTSGARERSAMRRRARRLRRQREAAARDLGLLVLELQHRRRDNPELVRQRTIALRAIDDELRGIGTALGRGDTVEQVVAAGIVGRCRECGSLIGTDDRYCSSCGTARVVTPQPVAGQHAAPQLEQ